MTTPTPNILDRATTDIKSVRSLLNRTGLINEPAPSPRAQDFPEGFIIEELDPNATGGGNPDTFPILNKISLVGNQMPIVPFSFTGGQRTNKVYYPGYDEPSMQVLGPTEEDVTIKGQLKAIRFRRDEFFKYPQQVRDFLDAIRYRGNLCRITLGDWVRHCILKQTKWSVIRQSRIDYQITFAIITHKEAPENARFLRPARAVPFDTGQELIEIASTMEAFGVGGPVNPITQSIFDEINGLIADVAVAIREVVSYANQVFAVAANIRRSVTRAVGMINFAKGRVFRLLTRVASFNPFDLRQTLSEKYSQVAYYTALTSGSVSLGNILDRYRRQFLDLIESLPLARYLVKGNDTWQKISVRFYSTSDHWAEIPRYNDLEISDPAPIGTVIEIPEISVTSTA